MTLCNPSATSLSISTPRLIGPGCMIRQSGFKSFARSFVRPNKWMYSPRPGKYSRRCRSCWIRKRFTTSAVGRTSSILCETSAPSFSNSRGTSVLGRTSVTRAPSLSRPKMFERATRLNKMSPMIATCSPAILPLRSRIVYRSRSACVGCSCAPSPALITLAFSRLARNCGAPAEPWRSTRISACNASRLRAVSLSVSPLVRLESLAEILITSALRRNAASSNEVRVRVLGSTKKFTSVLPRSAGTFLIWRVPTSLNASAVSRTKLISSADNSRRASSASGEKNVIDNDDGTLLKWHRKFRRMHDRQFRPHSHVVAMHRHVDDPSFNVDLFDLANEGGDSLRDLHPARRNSRKHHLVGRRISLNDLVRNSPKRPANCLGVHDRDG